MRARVSVGLWLLVALQLVIPASYYLLRDDRDDERFAWRMFSSVRMTRCQVLAFDGRTPRERAPVALTKTLHASWLRSLERGRKHVIEQFLASRCREPQVHYSQLERACTSPSGRALPEARYRYDCALQQLEVVQ